MRLTELVHRYLSTQLRPGDRAIDATSGNGHDTLHMAKLVGSIGRIIAIDIQKTAIAATSVRLEANDCLQQVELFLDDHSRALQSLGLTQAQTFNAITFNLGYLPGSDKKVQTKPETTLSALDASGKLLKPGGLLLLTAYRGHTGGHIEADHVARWMQQLSSHNWQIDIHDPSDTDKGVNQTAGNCFVGSAAPSRCAPASCKPTRPNTRAVRDVPALPSPQFDLHPTNNNNHSPPILWVARKLSAQSSMHSTSVSNQVSDIIRIQ